MDSKQVKTRSGFDRPALIGVTAVGMAMCAGGIGKVAVAGAWLSVQGVLGSALGLVILGIVGARLLGLGLPLVRSDRAAIAAVLALAVVKFAVAAAFPLA